VQNITQLEGERTTQSQDVLRGYRQYISAEKIRLLAQTKFKQSRKGLTYENLVNDGHFKCANTAQHARDTLHYHKREGHLFTFGRTNPQQYFATKDEAEMATIYREKNTHSDPTGVRSSSSPNGHSSLSRDGPPLANTLEYVRIQDFYHALIMLKVAPLAMHNIRLYLKLSDPQRYDVIPTHYEEENKAKVLRCRKGDVHTTYKVYPHGAVEIIIECSKAAFPIETDSEITELFSFVGGLCHTLQDWLHDVNAYIVPPIMQWRLVHADVCKDLKVPERLHLTVPNMEIRTAERVLRMYVKNLGPVSVLRLEEMRVFEEAFDEAVNSLRKGASSSSTAGTIFTHSHNPAAFVEIAELKRQNAMLISQMAEMREMMAESLKPTPQQIRVEKEIKCSEQTVVYDKEKEEAYNTAKSDSSIDDGYKQTPFNSHLRVTITSSAKVEDNRMEMFEIQQQEQQPIAIPQSTALDDGPIIISSAAELLEQRNNSNNHLRISTGSKKLDDLVGGGIERGAVTEIVGSSGTGKTELCFALSVKAQQKQKLGKASVNGQCEAITTASAKVLFIDTRKTFDRHRIYSIAQARGLDPDAAVESITVEMIQDFQALEEFIFEKLEEFLKKNPDTVLVIVDSIMALQPIQHKEEKDEYLSLWQESLDSLMYSLQRAALQHNIAVVVINDIDENVICDDPFGQTQVPTAKNIVLHAITHRLSLKHYDGNKVARIVHSSCQPEAEVSFTIEHEGITDIHQ
jgi:RecA/RadA recombinase